MNQPIEQARGVSESLGLYPRGVLPSSAIRLIDALLRHFHEHHLPGLRIEAGGYRWWLRMEPYPKEPSLHAEPVAQREQQALVHDQPLGGVVRDLAQTVECLSHLLTERAHLGGQPSDALVPGVRLRGNRVGAHGCMASVPHGVPGASTPGPASAGGSQGRVRGYRAAGEGKKRVRRGRG